ncbi:hypothetical protein [Sphingobium ummariense]|uniref:DUF2336 domain-containing protein n=1 Tax=Sphingobium ummariense RL-3 TaxID=1346791 RepID=T0J844_9SPHN|nr:hypothetical protein [Sphingobium ummariense]EQB34121.1 hypothetical protein M529_00465 [Sphingobium ummariense RL-3]
MAGRMNAQSSPAGTMTADSWPAARVLAGLSAVPVGHAIDLAFLFPDAAPPQHDALNAETRRHLAGCLTAVELALRLGVERLSDSASSLSDWPDPLCWPMLCAQPGLLGPGLLSHMRLRAGISLMLRQYGRAGMDPDNGEAEDIFSEDPALSEALSMLALAEARWLATAGETQPMRPDLPAEHFSELLWTAGACLAMAAHMSTGLSEQAILPLIERAAWDVLGRHDEGSGPIAVADRLVRMMGDRADDRALPGAVLGQRRFLLFAALAGRRLRMPTAQVVDILIMAPLPHVAALARALDCPDGDYRHLLMTLRPVRPALTDMLLVTEAERYQALDGNQADAIMDLLRTPAALRAKLDHLHQVMAA